MKKRWPLSLMVVGAVLFLVGGSMTFVIGIPGPDDPLDEVARRQSLSLPAFGSLLVGGLVFLVGVVASITKLLLRWSRSNRST